MDIYNYLSKFVRFPSVIMSDFVVVVELLIAPTG